MFGTQKFIKVTKTTSHKFSVCVPFLSFVCSISFVIRKQGPKIPGDSVDILTKRPRSDVNTSLNPLTVPITKLTSVKLPPLNAFTRPALRTSILHDNMLKIWPGG